MDGLKSFIRYSAPQRTAAVASAVLSPMLYPEGKASRDQARKAVTMAVG